MYVEVIASQMSDFLGHGVEDQKTLGASFSTTN